MSTQRAQRFRPGTAIEWDDENETRTGVVAEETAGLMRDFRIGPPGGPWRHFELVRSDDAADEDAAYVEIERLRAAGDR